MTNEQTAASAPAQRTADQVIGENVHRLMWRAQESQSALAPKWGMTQASLSLKLRGKRPWFAQEIASAARYFNVSVDALFETGDDEWAPRGSNPRPTD
jgi:hypothetical protein